MPDRLLFWRSAISRASKRKKKKKKKHAREEGGEKKKGDGSALSPFHLV